jgi:putative serine protease PepD
VSAVVAICDPPSALSLAPRGARDVRRDPVLLAAEAGDPVKSAHPSPKTALSLAVPRAILERTGHEQTIGDVVADGQSRWSADSAGGLVPSPDYSGALYDAGTGSSTHPNGAPSNALSNGGIAGNHAHSTSGPPTSSNGAGAAGPAGNSAWWTDARTDPWRDPGAPAAVILTAPQLDPVPAAEVDAPKRRVSLGQVLLISLLAALLAGGLGGALGYLAAVKGGLRDAVPLGNGSATTPGLAQRAPISLAAVAKSVLPSVVTVRVDSSLGSAIGSGFIVSSDGYMITNDHVIDGISGNATVTFNDASTAPAKLVGTDPETDIAVLKIAKSGLPAVTFGDSDAIAVGDPVLAIGAPLDLQNSVTAGIISSLRRPLEISDGSGPTRYYAAIQTDAAINHGNSGGPLVDAAGHVIGVDAVIKSLGSSDDEAGNIGLAFAIPINQAKRTAESIISTGKVQRTVIGASLQTSYHNPNGGVLLSSIAPGGPAAEAGLQPDDVVLSVGGTPLDAAGDLTAIVREYAPGSVVPVTFLRGTARHTVQVKLVASGD